MMVKNKKNLIYIIAGILLIGVLIVSYFMFFYNPYKFRGDGPVKIFWLNSYNEELVWSVDSFYSFEDSLKEAGIEYEVKSLFMDAFRDPSEENLESKKIEAMKIIDEWEPDLIYANDDHAQDVMMEYVNTDIPIVFSGVLYPPETYGYDKAKNVAGILENYHFKAAVNSLKAMEPGIKKVAVIADTYPQWEIMIDQLKKEAAYTDVEVIGWKKFDKYSDYKNYILDIQDKADAIVLLPPNVLTDENGEFVLQKDAVEWTVKNSNIPEVTFWSIMVGYGCLLSLDLSTKEQGGEAGIFAKKILIDGIKPSDMEFKYTQKWEQFINLARAKSLGIEKEDIPSTVLVNSKIYENFPWEENNETKG